MNHQDSLAYPGVANTTSATVTFYFRSRQTEGIGNFGSSNVPAALAVLFPQGRDSVLPLSAIVESVVGYALNDAAFIAWWNPASGTPEQCLRTALAGWRPSNPSSATVSVYVLIDGQFGPVLVT